MQTIDLAAVENQTFTTTIDGDFYDIDIFLAAGIMACNISRNNVLICSGQRIVGGSFLIPFFAYENMSGNFMLLTTETNGQSEIPFYTQFGLTQTLVYMSWTEINNIVNGLPPS